MDPEQGVMLISVMATFAPHISILPPPQQRFWKERLAAAVRAVDLDSLPEIAVLEEPDVLRKGGGGR